MTAPFFSRGIGLLGGTFDPVHTGHLALAREAIRQLRLLRVDFVPAPAPWQKNVLTPLNLRLAMLEAAMSGHAEFGINLTDVLREGATYTIDTVRDLRNAVGTSLPLILLIGQDQWVNFHTWKDWARLTDYVSIAVCSRGAAAGSPSVDVRDWAESRLTSPETVNEVPHGKITFFSMPEHAASSTKIRSLFASVGQREALRQLSAWLPPPTAALIARRNIY